jgi:hypothetical protein
MYDEMGIPGSTDRYDTIVIVARLVPIAVEDAPKLLAPFTPIQYVLFLVYPATAADTGLIERQMERMT